jgi:hypothetical protein
VRLLHQNLKLNIILSIVISALGYCLISFVLAGKLPQTGLAFWIACLCVMAIGVIAWFITPHRIENGSRTTLPWYIKYTAVFMVIFCLLLMKKWMSGYMANFPMLGVVLSYEGRFCLYSVCRQMPIILLSIVPMMAVCSFFQNSIGIYFSIVLGWIVMLIFLVPLMKIVWNSQIKENIQIVNV